METGARGVGQMFTNNWTRQGSGARAGKTAAKSLVEKTVCKWHPSIIYDTHVHGGALLCWGISVAEKFLCFHHIPDV